MTDLSQLDALSRRVNTDAAAVEMDQFRTDFKAVWRTWRDSGVIIQPFWRSLFRSHREGVHGFEMHQSFEQHLDLAWIES
jgi:peptide/nickel transport system substrate-binding protein